MLELESLRLQIPEDATIVSFPYAWQYSGPDSSSSRVSPQSRTCGDQVFGE